VVIRHACIGTFRNTHRGELAKKYEQQPMIRAVVDLGIADTGERVIAAADLAFVYALSGDLAAADRWRDEAQGTSESKTSRQCGSCGSSR
jgi:hypothetical protein